MFNYINRAIPYNSISVPSKNCIKELIVDNKIKESRVHKIIQYNLSIPSLS